MLTMLKLRQIGFADLVVLNKTDLVGSQHIEVIRDWIGLHMTRVRIVEAVEGEVPLEILLSVGRFDPTNLVEQMSGAGSHLLESAGSVFATWSYESDQPLSVDALRHMIRRDLPASVYRCKGIVYVADNPKKRCVLQTVGRRTRITEFDDWGDSTPRSRIVAIGSSQGLAEASLTGLFEACTVSLEGHCETLPGGVSQAEERRSPE